MLKGHLDPEISAGNHEAVEGLHDLLESVDRLRLLDLGDDRNPSSLFVHDFRDGGEVVTRSYERQRDHVGAYAQAPTQVVDVLLAHGGHRQRRARHVDPLVVGDRAAFDHHRVDPWTINRDDLKADAAVVDQNSQARMDVAGQAGVRRRSKHLATGNVFGGDRELSAGSQCDRPAGEPAKPDLRALQVDHDADSSAAGVGCRTHQLVDLLVIVVRAMAEVQPCDVHARIDESSNGLRRVGRRPQSADDLCAATHVVSLGRELIGHALGTRAIR